MSFIYESTDITLDNIAVEKQFYKGNHIAYRLTANDGYVMYDTTENNRELDENGNEVQVIYYCRQVTIPASVPVEDWTYVAVAEICADTKEDEVM